MTLLFALQRQIDLNFKIIQSWVKLFSDEFEEVFFV